MRTTSRPGSIVKQAVDGLLRVDGNTHPCTTRNLLLAAVPYPRPSQPDLDLPKAECLGEYPGPIDPPSSVFASGDPTLALRGPGLSNMDRLSTSDVDRCADEGVWGVVFPTAEARNGLAGEPACNPLGEPKPTDEATGEGEGRVCGGEVGGQ